MKFYIKPIYGNGWTDRQEIIDEPPEFICDLSLEGETYTGFIESEFKEIDGSKFEASPRYENDRSVFNCKISNPGRCIYGYCEMKIV